MFTTQEFKREEKSGVLEDFMRGCCDFAHEPHQELFEDGNLIFQTDYIHIPTMGGWVEETLPSSIQEEEPIQLVEAKQPQQIECKENNLKAQMGQNLSERDDVVNKSILRLIRRFFNFNLKERYPPIRYRMREKRIKYFYNSLQFFAYFLMASKEGLDSSFIQSSFLRAEDKELQYFSVEKISQILNIEPAKELHKVVRTVGYLINRKYMEEAEKDLGVQKDLKLFSFLRQFNECCHKYTHKRFKVILHNNYFHDLYKLFYTVLIKSSGVNTEDLGKKPLEKEEIFRESIKIFKIEKINPSKYLERLKEIYGDLF